MKQKPVNEHEFNLALTSVDRVWDGQKGLGMQEAKSKGLIDDLAFIFIRGDDWSVACSAEHKDSCKALYEDTWRMKISLVTIEESAEQVDIKSAYDKLK